MRRDKHFFNIPGAGFLFLHLYHTVSPVQDDEPVDVGVNILHLVIDYQYRTTVFFYLCHESHGALILGLEETGRSFIEDNEGVVKIVSPRYFKYLSLSFSQTAEQV